MFVTTDADVMCFSEKQQKKPLHQLLQWLCYGMMCYPFSLFLLLMYVRCP